MKTIVALAKKNVQNLDSCLAFFNVGRANCRSPLIISAVFRIVKAAAISNGLIIGRLVSMAYLAALVTIIAKDGSLTAICSFSHVATKDVSYGYVTFLANSMALCTFICTRLNFRRCLKTPSQIITNVSRVNYKAKELIGSISSIAIDIDFTIGL